MLPFRVEGSVDGVDVAGRSVVLAILTPKLMVDGNWQAGLLIDQHASDEQIAVLTKVFTGQVGGPMAGLAPLITGFLGAERAAIDLDVGADGWSLRVGDATELEGAVILGPDSDEAVTLTGIVANQDINWIRGRERTFAETRGRRW